MKKKVLVAKPAYKKFSPTGYQMLLDQGYDVITTDLDRDYYLEELLPLVGDIDGCIANCEPWGEEAMSAAPKLKILARYGTGMNSVDTEAAKRHGIMVTNCPGVNANAVAEHVIALMMGAVRDLVHLNDMTKQGLWKNLTFHEVAGATVGILGFGAIGRLVAKKLTGFDCRVLAYDVAPDYEVGDQYHVNFASFEEVMSQSDIIFILVPLLPDTENMINRESLSLVKPGVITLERLMELMHDNPCKRFGIRQDAAQYYTVWDLDAEYTIDPAAFLSMGKSTPFEGWKVCGRCIKTVTSAGVVYVTPL